MKKITSFFVFLLITLSASADTITVDANGFGDYPTIQAAIDAANPGDHVVLTPGIYTGYRNYNIDFKGKAITVRSIDPQDPCIVAATIIGSEYTYISYGFYFESDETASSILDGLTITNCWRSAIYCGYSSPTIRNCNIRGNGFAPTGIRDGAGIYCNGGNWYWSPASPTIVNCTISNNTAHRYGGGIYCKNDSRPTIEKCTITGNSAGIGGGGIYIDNYMYHDESSADIRDCVFTANSAQNGGAIYHKTNSSGYGPPLAIIQSDIVANSASNLGGGIFCDGDAPIQLTNCILWANTDGSGTALSANIHAANKEVIFSCISDDDPNDGYILFGDANEQNIDDYPGFVRDPNDGADGWGVGNNDDYGDLHLRSDSPCINAGHPIFSESFEKDIDGQPRIIGGRIDMGADEFELKIITVTRPKAGEVWTRNSRHEIRWTACGIENVDILFSKNGGGTWQGIESGIPANSSYMWDLPNIQSEQCIISIIPATPDANAICIESGTFEIKHYPNRPPAPPGQVRKNKWGRTGLSEYYGPQLGCVKWQLDTDGPVTSAAADGGGSRIYVGSEDGKLYALEKDSGALIWSYDTNSPLLGSPATGYYGMVYVCAEDGKLYAIDGDGNLKWTYTADAEIYSSPVVSPDGRIYICSQDGVVQALGHNGSELWKFEIGGADVSDANLAAYWKFDENTGTTAADSAGGNDGTIHAAEWTAGRLNSGLRFKPVSFVDIPDFDLSGNWTISLWIEASGASYGYYYGDNCTILGNPGDQNNIFRLMHSWPWRVEFVNSAGINVQWYFLEFDAFYYQWRLVTLVANETEIELFIDGVSQGTRTIEPTIEFHNIGSGVWNQDTGTIDIDEFRLYNRPLSSDEVGTLADFGVLRGAFFASPTVGADGTVYIGGLYAPELYALNPADGSLKWACNFESEINLEYDPYRDWLRYLLGHTKTGWPFASPVTAQDGTIYQTLLYDPSLYAIDANNGDILWSTNLADSESGWFDCKYDQDCGKGFHDRPGCYYAFRYYWRADGWSEPAVGPDGTIYVSLDDPYLRAIDPNGSIKWVSRLGMVGGFTLTVGSDGLIYAAGDDGHLYVVEPDGEQIALFQNDTPLSSPVIAQDNLVIVSDANNAVWAIGGDGCQSHELHRPADLNSDEMVNFTDFGILAADWLCCTDKEMDVINDKWFPNIPDCDYGGDGLYLRSDVDRDLHIDAADLAEIANRWLIED